MTGFGGWQWHQLNHMLTIFTSLQTDNHINTSSLNFYRSGALPDAQPHTHPFNGPLSRTARVGRYQKGKTSLDFTEARDSEWQWHRLDQSAPRSRQITTPTPHHSVFYRPDALPVAQPTASNLFAPYSYFMTLI